MADKPARTGVDAIPETGIDTTFDTLTNEEIDTYQRAFDLHVAFEDFSERLKYSAKTYNLIAAWLSVDLAVLLAQAWRFNGFDLPQSVIVTLIGGTTASVVGMFVVVLKYLFHRSADV